MVSSYFYPDGGGAENYAYNIAKRLVKRGHSIAVLCSNRRKGEQKEFIDGIQIIRLSPHFFISNTPIKLGLLPKMVRLLKHADFDLVSINFALPYYSDIAAIAGRI